MQDYAALHPGYAAIEELPYHSPGPGSGTATSSTRSCTRSSPCQRSIASEPADMHGWPRCCGQRVAERLADRAKRDGVDDRAVAGLEPHAHMRLPDFVGIDELMRRQRDHRLGIAGAERAGAVEHRGQFRRHRPRADGAVDEQLVVVARSRDIAAPARFQKARNSASLSLRSVTPAAMAWPPPLISSPAGDRLTHRLAEIDAGDRAARAGADAARLERDRERRPAEFFLQPRGDQPDDAGMPALGRR